MKTLWTGLKWLALEAIFAIAAVQLAVRVENLRGVEAGFYLVCAVLAAIGFVVLAWCIGEGMSDWEDRNGPPIKND